MRCWLQFHTNTLRWYGLELKAEVVVQDTNQTILLILILHVFENMLFADTTKQSVFMMVVRSKWVVSFKPKF